VITGGSVIAGVGPESRNGSVTAGGGVVTVVVRAGGRAAAGFGRPELPGAGLAHAETLPEPRPRVEPRRRRRRDRRRLRRRLRCPRRLGLAPTPDAARVVVPRSSVAPTLGPRRWRRPTFRPAPESARRPSRRFAPMPAFTLPAPMLAPSPTPATPASSRAAASRTTGVSPESSGRLDGHAAVARRGSSTATSPPRVVDVSRARPPANLVPGQVQRAGGQGGNRGAIKPTRAATLRRRRQGRAPPLAARPRAVSCTRLLVHVSTRNRGVDARADRDLPRVELDHVAVVGCADLEGPLETANRRAVFAHDDVELGALDHRDEERRPTRSLPASRCATS